MLATTAKRRQPQTERFTADIANLLFEPKVIAVLTITAATAQPFNPPPLVQGPPRDGRHN
jgi:hypothetical protein